MTARHFYDALDITEEGRRTELEAGLASVPEKYNRARRALRNLAGAADSIEDEVRAWEMAFGFETPAEALEWLQNAWNGPVPLPVARSERRVIPATERWAWGLTEELSGGVEDSREEAIAVARAFADDDGEPDATVYVCGDIEDSDPGSYVPGVEDILDHMTAAAYHDLPDSLEDESWPRPSPEARRELLALLVPIRAWARRHLSTWWTVVGEVEAVPASDAEREVSPDSRPAPGRVTEEPSPRPVVEVVVAVGRGAGLLRRTRC